MRPRVSENCWRLHYYSGGRRQGVPGFPRSKLQYGGEESANKAVPFFINRRCFPKTEVILLYTYCETSINHGPCPRKFLTGYQSSLHSPDLNTQHTQSYRRLQCPVVLQQFGSVGEVHRSAPSPARNNNNNNNHVRPRQPQPWRPFAPFPLLPPLPIPLSTPPPFPPPRSTTTPPPPISLQLQLQLLLFYIHPPTTTATTAAIG